MWKIWKCSSFLISILWYKYQRRKLFHVHIVVYTQIVFMISRHWGEMKYPTIKERPSWIFPQIWNIMATLLIVRKRNLLITRFMTMNSFMSIMFMLASVWAVKLLQWISCMILHRFKWWEQSLPLALAQTHTRWMILGSFSWNFLFLSLSAILCTNFLAKFLLSGQDLTLHAFSALWKELFCFSFQLRHIGRRLQSFTIWIPYI